jgi:hypothetical protein
MVFQQYSFDRKSDFLKYLLRIFLRLSEFRGSLTYVTGPGSIPPLT